MSPNRSSRFAESEELISKTGEVTGRGVVGSGVDEPEEVPDAERAENVVEVVRDEGEEGEGDREYGWCRAD